MYSTLEKVMLGIAIAINIFCIVMAVRSYRALAKNVQAKYHDSIGSY